MCFFGLIDEFFVKLGREYELCFSPLSLFLEFVVEDVQEDWSFLGYSKGVFSAFEHMFPGFRERKKAKTL